MSILSIVTDFAGQIGTIPRIIRIDSTDNYSTITTTGYLNNAKREGYTFYPSDIAAVTYGSNISQLFSVVIDSSGNVSLLSSFIYVTDQSGNGQTVTTTNSSATPGTIRAFRGKFVETATTITSGNIVGIRGEVDCVGASGGFIYGVQGKVIPTGTISGSVWVAGLFGQFDLSHATITTGQLAAVWADYGATATSGTYTGARMYAGTNTTAAILNSQIYLYGGATNLFELDDNNGLVGATYFVNAGTSSGSAGNSTHCAAQKVITCSFNGSSVYIPVFTQNT